jgi:hypothetical protein
MSFLIVSAKVSSSLDSNQDLPMTSLSAFTSTPFLIFTSKSSSFLHPASTSSLVRPEKVSFLQALINPARGEARDEATLDGVGGIANDGEVPQVERGYAL